MAYVHELVIFSVDCRLCVIGRKTFLLLEILLIFSFVTSRLHCPSPGVETGPCGLEPQFLTTRPTEMLFFVMQSLFCFSMPFRIYLRLYRVYVVLQYKTDFVVWFKV